MTAPNPSFWRCEKLLLRRAPSLNIMRRMLAVINAIKHKRLQIVHRIRLAERNHQCHFGTYFLVTIVPVMRYQYFIVKLSLSARKQPVPYAYNTVTESRYNFTEFKGLLIDFDGAVRLTDEIGQFKALQGVDDSMHFDVNIAESVSFTFGIDSTASLKSINFITFLKSIIFHIVSINISFLLCLADMNRLKIFFKNVINQLIQSNQAYFVICKYNHAFLK